MFDRIANIIILAFALGSVLALLVRAVGLVFRGRLEQVVAAIEIRVRIAE